MDCCDCSGTPAGAWAHSKGTAGLSPADPGDDLELNDLWELLPGTEEDEESPDPHFRRRWRPHAASGVPPPPRRHHSAVFLPPDARANAPGGLYVFGGCRDREGTGTTAPAPVAPAEQDCRAHLGLASGAPHRPCPSPPGAGALQGAQVRPCPRDTAVQLYNDLWWCRLPQLSQPGPCRWERLECAGDVPAPREGHSAAVVPGRRHMYVCGGLAAAEAGPSPVYQCSLPPGGGCGIWTRVRVFGSVPRARAFAAHASVDTRLYLFGGQDADGVVYGDLHTLDLRHIVPAEHHGLGCDTAGDLKRGTARATAAAPLIESVADEVGLPRAPQSLGDRAHPSDPVAAARSPLTEPCVRVATGACATSPSHWALQGYADVLIAHYGGLLPDPVPPPVHHPEGPSHTPRPRQPPPPCPPAPTGTDPSPVPRAAHGPPPAADPQSPGADAPALRHTDAPSQSPGGRDGTPAGPYVAGAHAASNTLSAATDTAAAKALAPAPAPAPAPAGNSSGVPHDTPSSFSTNAYGGSSVGAGAPEAWPTPLAPGPVSPATRPPATPSASASHASGTDACMPPPNRWDVNRLQRSGDVLCDAHDYAAAAEAYRAAQSLAARAGDTAAECWAGGCLACALLPLGRAAEAHAALAHARAHAGAPAALRARVLIEAAAALRRVGDLRGASAHLRDALRDLPHDGAGLTARGQTELGIVAAQEGRWPQAVPALSQGLQALAPASVAALEGHAALAVALRETEGGLRESAARHLRSISAWLGPEWTTPGSVSATSAAPEAGSWAALGWCWGLLGGPPCPAVCPSHYVARPLQDHAADLHRCAGLAALVLQDYEAALAHLGAALAAPQQDRAQTVALLCEKGVALRQLGHWALARGCHTQARAQCGEGGDGAPGGCRAPLGTGAVPLRAMACLCLGDDCLACGDGEGASQAFTEVCFVRAALGFGLWARPPCPMRP